MLNLLSTDGCGDGVSDGRPKQIAVLTESAEPILGCVEVGFHCVHVGVVSFPVDWVRSAVAISEEA